MRAARILVLVVALIAGLAAAMLAGRSNAPPPVEQAAPAPIATSDVLVAAADIPMGDRLTAQNMRWQAWPDGALSPHFIQKSDRPNAVQDYEGAIARTPFVEGEPLRAEKLIKTDGSGFMSAILSSGMRAIATEVSAETVAGGFILPNDRVDVILTRRVQNAGRDDYSSDTILSNVRVLAIDQTVEDKDGEKTVVPQKTATLELTPPQAEALALAKQLGTVSLSLRPLADARRDSGPESARSNSSGMTIVRYGVAQQVTNR